MSLRTKVWCLGLSRTGTSTLSEALKAAELNHIHYPSKWDMFHGIHDGCGDISVIPYYKELDIFIMISHNRNLEHMFNKVYELKNQKFERVK